MKTEFHLWSISTEEFNKYVTRTKVQNISSCVKLLTYLKLMPVQVSVVNVEI